MRCGHHWWWVNQWLRLWSWSTDPTRVCPVGDKPALVWSDQTGLLWPLHQLKMECAWLASVVVLRRLLCAQLRLMKVAEALVTSCAVMQGL